MSEMSPEQTIHVQQLAVLQQTAQRLDPDDPLFSADSASNFAALTSRLALQQQLQALVGNADAARFQVQSHIQFKQIQIAALQSIQDNAGARGGARASAERGHLIADLEVAAMTPLHQRIAQTRAWAQDALEQVRNPTIGMSDAELRAHQQRAETATRALGAGREALATLYSIDTTNRFLDDAQEFITLRTADGKIFQACNLTLPLGRGPLVLASYDGGGSINDHEQAYNALPGVQARLFERGTPVDGNIHHRNLEFLNHSYVDIQSHVPTITNGRWWDYLWQGYTVQYFSGAGAPPKTWTIFGWYYANSVGLSGQAAGPSPDTCDIANRPGRYVWSSWRSGNADLRAPAALELQRQHRRSADAAPDADIQPLVQALAGFAPQTAVDSTAQTGAQSSEVQQGAVVAAHV